MSKLRNFAALVAMLLGTVVFAPAAVAPASAQQTNTCPSGGYPPCRPQGQPGSGERDFGVFRAGENFDKVDCGFDGGATATLTFNGAEAGNAPVGDDGCTRFNVAVGSDRRVTFNGRTFTGRCGPNSIVVTAPAGGGTRTVTNNFIISCGGGEQGAAASRGGVIPRTGSDALGLGAAGVALSTVGTALVVLARRRRRTIPVEA